MGILNQLADGDGLALCHDFRLLPRPPGVPRLEPEDLPILGMRVAGATLPEIASVLRVEEREVSRRLTAMLGRLAGPLTARADG